MKDMLGQYKVQCVLPILTGCGLEFLCSKGSQASWKRENWDMSWLLAPGLSASPGSQASGIVLGCCARTSRSFTECVVVEPIHALPFI